ncbi:MAG TPA: efflux RND transporter periplasmic adaptor subunit, partial [Thermoanaerobaculia bacterium]|nr:efflux RND transporter periplasmic adaptor subunit [Thermoanaerobaculia bacterium]
MLDTRRTTLLVGLIFLGLAVVLWAKPGDDEDAPAAAAFRPVRVAPVERVEAGRELAFPGVTRAERRAALAFTQPARVAERPVEVGDRVEAGQVLARLDADEYRLAEQSAAAAVAELDVRLAQAERDQARVEQLAAARAATAEEVEQTAAATAAIRAAHEAATARLGETRRRLDEAVLRAPFAATVTAVRLEPGEWAAPGAPVVELAGRGAVEVRVEVPESIRTDLAAGDPVRIALPMTG